MPQARADNERIFNPGFTPLMFAVTCGAAAPGLTRALLGAEGVDVDVHRTNTHGATALALAVEHGREDVVRLLAEAMGSDINAGEHLRPVPTPLMIAAAGGDDAMVAVLLGAGSNARYKHRGADRDTSGASTALMAAVTGMHTPGAQHSPAGNRRAVALLAGVPDLNLDDYDPAPVPMPTGHLPALRQDLTSGLHQTQRIKTPLMALEAGNATGTNQAAIDALVVAGADPDVVNWSDRVEEAMSPLARAYLDGNGGDAARSRAPAPWAPYGTPPLAAGVASDHARDLLDEFLSRAPAGDIVRLASKVRLDAAKRRALPYWQLPHHRRHNRGLRSAVEEVMRIHARQDRAAATAAAATAAARPPGSEERGSRWQPHRYHTATATARARVLGADPSAQAPRTSFADLPRLPAELWLSVCRFLRSRDFSPLRMGTHGYDNRHAVAPFVLSARLRCRGFPRGTTDAAIYDLSSWDRVVLHALAGYAA